MFWSVLLAVSLSLPAPIAAKGNPKRAAQTAKQAEQLWRDGHYGEASALLGKAYEQDPNPAYLFARANVENDAGHCEIAVDLFEQFIATGPPEQDAQAARDTMAPCKEQLDEQERVEQERLEEERAAEEDRLEEERRAEELRARQEAAKQEDKPVRKDVLGGVLMGTGAAATGAGIGTLVAGLVVHGNAEDASTADGFVDDSERGRLMTGIGIGVLAAGVALMTAGAIRYGLLARKRKAGDLARTRRWQATVGPTGLGVRF